MHPTFTLVVPVYNEEDRFPEVADELVGFVESLPAGGELIVVDDGSSDRTADTVRARLDENRHRIKSSFLSIPHAGKGAAVRAGLLAATADYTGFCDVDLATPLEEVARLRDIAVETGGLAIASRGAPGATLVRRQSSVRELLGRLYNRLLRWTLIDAVLDTQCGAKVAPTAVWQKLLQHSEERGMAWDVEIVAVAQRLGLPIDEVPVRWSHDERSRVRTWRDGPELVLSVPRIARRVRDLPSQREVFDTGRQETLLEPHWWFRSKAAFVGQMLGELATGNGRTILVDLGAGSGLVTAALREVVAHAVAVEGSEFLARHARGDHGVDVALGRLEHVPLREGCADVVTLLDVIEHLDDPAIALREARKVVRADGHVVLTVPAHRWLWSEVDGFLGHRRRYTRRALRDELRAGGFVICRMSHVFSWLLLPVWLRRRLPRSIDEKTGLSTKSSSIDWAARVLTAIERQVLRHASMPFGTSIIAVARAAC